jgi:hypothetical protein
MLILNKPSATLEQCQEWINNEIQNIINKINKEEE